MKSTKFDFRKAGSQAKAAWRHRWVRVVTGAVVVLVAWSSGHQQGELDSGPRGTGSPGSVVTERQLHGLWDGIGTLEDGTPFCMAGWSCADLGDK